MRKAITKRHAALAAQKVSEGATTPAEGLVMIYIENDGALFRGVSRGLPKEVWSRKAQAWKPNTFDEPFKPIGWGTVISEAEATKLMGEP